MKDTVMVTGVGGGGVGAQIVKALNLADRPYEIIACDSNSETLRFVDAQAHHVLPRADAPDYRTRILEIARRYDAKVLFPGSEAELGHLATAREELSSAGLSLAANNPEVISICLDKEATVSFLEREEFAHPETVTVFRLEDTPRPDILPAVVKPAEGGGGSAHTYIAQTSEELATFVGIVLQAGSAALVQEYVGTPDNEYTVGVLCTRDGTVVNSIACRRQLGPALSRRTSVPNRSDRADLGDALVISSGVSQGEFGRFPEVCEPSEAIARALGATCAINVQGRLSDGRFSVFEINPRFSGTTSMRAMLGYNEPDLVARELIHGETPQAGFTYDEATILRGLQERKLDGSGTERP